MGIRLLSSGHLDGWRGTIADAMAQAGAAQHASVGSALTANGMTWDSPRGGPVALWSDAAWTAAVQRHVQPAALTVARSIIAQLNSRRPKTAPWGSPSFAAELAGMVVDRAVQGGPYIAGRLGLVAAGGNPSAIHRAVGDAARALNPDAGRYGGVPHPDAVQTVADEFQGRIAQLGDLAANVAGPMANYATQQYAAAQAEGAGVTFGWVCMELPTSREDHVDAQDQDPVPPGTPFLVGGEELMFPGDPSGSDEQTCNCLCVLDTNGLPDDVAEAEAA